MTFQVQSGITDDLDKSRRKSAHLKDREMQLLKTLPIGVSIYNNDKQKLDFSNSSLRSILLSKSSDSESNGLSASLLNSIKENQEINFQNI